MKRMMKQIHHGNTMDQQIDEWQKNLNSIWKMIVYIDNKMVLEIKIL